MHTNNIGNSPPPFGLYWIPLAKVMGSRQVAPPFGALWSNIWGVTIDGEIVKSWWGLGDGTSGARQ